MDKYEFNIKVEQIRAEKWKLPLNHLFLVMILQQPLCSCD